MEEYQDIGGGSQPRWALRHYLTYEAIVVGGAQVGLYLK